MAGATSSSDLGRRLQHRRQELGLSLESAAAAAHVDASYLHYLESAPSPDPSRGTLLRLALSLGTSPAALLGGDQLRPPGRGPEQPPAELLELDAERSLRLIAPGGVGRVVFVDTRGPVALPVNYKLVGDGIVFRSQRTTSIGTAASGHRISFEADHIDDTFSEGWSVLVTGTAHRVDDEDVAGALGPEELRPWADGSRDSYFVIEPELVTGRQLRREAR